jgi:hypothetical protein
VTGAFSNGRTAALGQIALAKFGDVQGLERIGANLFQETLASGQAVVGSAGTGGRGFLSGGALELSNVDIAAEFCKLHSRPACLRIECQGRDYLRSDHPGYDQPETRLMPNQTLIRSLETGGRCQRPSVLALTIPPIVTREVRQILTAVGVRVHTDCSPSRK